MTLLELLIATALVAIAALVVAQAFSAGFRVWSRASQLGGNYADSVIALESFQQDVRNTIPCRKAAFRGGPTWVEIPGLVMGNEKEAIREPLGLIRYEFDSVGQKFERVITSCQDNSSDISRRECLAGGVKSITILYAESGDATGGSLAWGGAWEGRTNNPVAVKVMWRGQQGDETFEFERTVSMPVR